MTRVGSQRHSETKQTEGLSDSSGSGCKTDGPKVKFCLKTSRKTQEVRTHSSGFEWVSNPRSQCLNNDRTHHTPHAA